MILYQAAPTIHDYGFWKIVDKRDGVNVLLSLYDIFERNKLKVVERIIKTNENQ